MREVFFLSFSLLSLACFGQDEIPEHGINYHLKDNDHYASLSVLKIKTRRQFTFGGLFTTTGVGSTMAGTFTTIDDHSNTTFNPVKIRGHTLLTTGLIETTIGFVLLARANKNYQMLKRRQWLWNALH